MEEKVALKPCPCGEVPETLGIQEGNGAKWAFAVCPCGDWMIEFRTGYNALDSVECAAAANAAWNDANRKETE